MCLVVRGIKRAFNFEDEIFDKIETLLIIKTLQRFRLNKKIRNTSLLNVFISYQNEGES